MKFLLFVKESRQKSSMKVSEPASTYGTSSLQGLKNRLIATIDASTDERKLEQCWELLQSNDMPCVFTDEEFAEEVRLSEASGFISQEEAEAIFAQWGFVR